MPDGFVPLPSLTGDLAQHELSRSVIGSDLQLFLEFCLCALHIRRRLRKKNAPDTIVNARQLRLLLEDPLVFGNGLIPVFLRLEGFCRVAPPDAMWAQSPPAPALHAMRAPNRSGSCRRARRDRA